MRTTLLFSLALLIVIAAAAALAGPLNPPPGPVSPTYRTLSEIEPRTPIQSLPGSPSAQFIITQPGSYVVTGPITGVPGKSAIEVAADNVSIDLRGFLLTGVADAIDGIRVASPTTNLTIRNGTARNWPGIAINTASASFAALTDLHADASGSGILAGASTTLTRCSATNNALAGIATGADCLITDCLAQSNAHDGFYLSDGCTADRCIATLNTGHGFYLDGDDCTVRSCTARSNSAGGVTSIYSCTVESTTAAFNAGFGIASSGPATIRNCTASSNDQGGISAADSSTVTSCRADANAAFGIRIGSRGRVESCTCASTPAPGAGLLITGAQNRIESNTLTGNDTGMKALGPANLIIRNDAAGNATAYDLVPNQDTGPIVSSPIPDPGPWANFQR